MVKIRRVNDREDCNSCLKRKEEVNQLYEIGIGKTKNVLAIICLCDGCMHELLQKLISIGSTDNDF